MPSPLDDSGSEEGRARAPLRCDLRPARRRGEISIGVWFKRAASLEPAMRLCPDLRPLPIKLDSTSNGEFAPVPLDKVAVLARSSAAAAVEKAARRVGLSRRDYLV